MKLINTIEISPYEYANENYETPDGSFKKAAEAWDHFWKKCLSDSQLGNLSAIKKGSFLVDISSITDNELEIIIQHELQNVDLEYYDDEIYRLAGGIVLQFGDDFVIEPTCCGDIGNIQEWEEIFEAKTSIWKQLWIGHPWVFYKKENNQVHISDYYEKNLAEIEQIKTILTVPENALKTQLDLIKKQHLAFQERIKETLEMLGIPHSLEISKLMTGL